jgi:hypothetical protein
VLFAGGSRPKRSRYVDPSAGRHQDQQDARVAAAIKMKRLEERKKKSLFANIADLKKLTKQEYHEFREQKFYLMPRDINNGSFYRSEHQRIFEQVYECMSTKVCPMKVTNIVSLSKDEYFADALWVTEKLGLHKLMVFKQDYNPSLIQQFYAMLEFDSRDEVGFTWMLGDVRKSSTIARFGQLLGYRFDGIHRPRGARLHLGTTEYNKRKIQCLYGPGGKAGETANLLPLYDILLRMFRANIAPSGGNNDSIRGGLVHLLHHARLVFEAGRECEGMELDVMYFIFSEMKIAMLDKKIPPYAPYIMRLIIERGIEGDFEIEEDFLGEDLEVHKPNKLYKKTSHLLPSTSSAFPSSSDVMGGNRYASGCRRKNADTPSGGMGQEMKKLKWWQRALFCMNNNVRQTQYKDYVDRKHVHKKQWHLDARLRIVEKGKGASTQEESQEKDKSEDTFSFGKWNEGSSFDWKELAEVTSKGKEAIEEDDEEEDGDEDGEDDDHGDDDEDDEDFDNFEE